MRNRNSGDGFLAGLFAMSGGGFGCLLIVCVVMIGPWCLQYDLNHWLPIIHRHFSSINDVTPVHMSLLIIVVGVFAFGIAMPVAFVTMLLFGLRIIG